MTTAAKDYPRIYDFGPERWMNELPCVASDIIYEGSAVGELNNTGTYQPLGTGSTVDKFAGFAFARCDNSAGSAGDRKVQVVQQGRIKLSVTGVSAITDVGKDVWATDDNTFTLTYAAGAVWIGRISRWETGTTCIVSFQAFEFRAPIQITHDAETVDLATDRAIFLATRPYYIVRIWEIHSVAAGGTSVLQIVKDTGTTAPGAGTDLLSAGFDLNGTANTLQEGALATTAGLRKLNAGDRISRDNADAIQSTAGVKVGIELIPL